MSVTLRWKSYPNGTKSAYLHVYENGKRYKKFIDIKIPKGKVHIPVKLTRAFRWNVTTQSQVKKVV